MGRKLSWALLCMKEEADIILKSASVIWTLKIALSLSPIKLVELECQKVGLGLNVKKTKSMFFNVDVSTVAGEVVKQSFTESGDQDFKYLGSWIEQEWGIKTQKALEWKALYI